jgi:hypothetical protein
MQCQHALFFLTHAYVVALEAGAETITDLHHRLNHYGRELQSPSAQNYGCRGGNLSGQVVTW